MLKTVGLALFLLLVNCSHQPIPRAPATDLTLEYFKAKHDTSGEAHAKLLEQEANCMDESCRRQIKYLRALASLKKPDSLSCQLFTELRKENDFIVSKTALIRQSQACPPNQEIYEDLVDLADERDIPRWMKITLLKEARQQALKLSLPDDYLDLTIQVVGETRSHKVKVELLEEALPVAKNHNEGRFQEIQNKLFEIAPRLVPLPEDWMVSSLDAMKARNYEFAISGFEKVVANPDVNVSIKRRALEHIRLSYKISQNKPKALLTTRRLVLFDEAQIKQDPKDIELLKNLKQSALLLAGTFWNMHESVKAKKVLNKLEKKYSQQIPMDDVYTMLARIEEEAKHFKTALKWYDKALLTPSLSQMTQEQLTWRKAWVLIKFGKYDEALPLLQALYEKEMEASNKRNQLLFWIAKIQKRKELPEARITFQQVITEDPIGYYGLMSYRELQIPLPRMSRLEISSSRIARKLSLQSQTRWEELEWLLSIGETQFAKQYLGEEGYLPDASFHEWQEIAQYYGRAGNFAALFGKIGSLSADEKRALLVENPKLLFPTPFFDIVTIESSKWGVSPYFAYAIMRQESSFDPEAISHADAYGLMQLLPMVAAHMKDKVKVDYKQPDDLLDPAMNIPLGVAFLKELSDKYKNQFILITASYNASEDSVKHWVKTRFRDDPVEFIEDIPYEETRTYVKLVLRNMVHYMRLDSQAETLPFPESCLKGLQAFRF